MYLLVALKIKINAAVVTEARALLLSTEKYDAATAGTKYFYFRQSRFSRDWIFCNTPVMRCSRHLRTYVGRLVF